MRVEVARLSGGEGGRGGLGWRGVGWCVVLWYEMGWAGVKGVVLLGEKGGRVVLSGMEWGERSEDGVRLDKMEW